MSYPKKVRIFPAGVGAAGHLGALDISDASNTTEFTWVPASDCVIYGFGGTCTEATGTQTTTPGVVSMEINAVEVSEITAAISAAIGTEIVDLSFDPIKVLAGTPVVFKVKTQAVGGTVTGEYAPMVYAEMFAALEGVA